jgi:hypothetical protein
MVPLSTHQAPSRWLIVGRSLDRADLLVLGYQAGVCSLFSSSIRLYKTALYFLMKFLRFVKHFILRFNGPESQGPMWDSLTSLKILTPTEKRSFSYALHSIIP